jgi:hypothetical protein
MLAMHGEEGDNLAAGGDEMMMGVLSLLPKNKFVREEEEEEEE